MDYNVNSFDEWTNVSLMNDEDIDYSIIPDTVLEELALGNELYIATSALVELWMRENIEIVPISWKILSTSHGDSYLQATALSILFSTNKEKASDYMSTKAETCNLIILNKMMKLMVENPADFAPNSTIIQTIIERLKNLSDQDQLIEPNIRQDFIQLYNTTPLLA